MSIRDARGSRARLRAIPSRKEAFPPLPATAPERFRSADRYRAEREWARYQGTSQRDLWRELRERFLLRHARASPWVLDLGSGPGRFTPFLGTARSERVALDLSREMLRSAREHWSRAEGPALNVECVRADGLAPPFPEGTFGEVAVLGNTVGFAGSTAQRLLGAASSLVAPGGTLVVEVSPGPGELSRYLRRLPPTTLARLFRSPVRALLSRIAREGFERIPYRRAERAAFRRVSVEELSRWLEKDRWDFKEVVAVAPALGPWAPPIDAIRADAKAWEHLLLVEEELGRRTERWTDASAVLVAAARPTLK